ncbi:MAG: acyl-CoA dehydrogenase family protein [Sulfolobaceae archaeon]
MFEEFRERVRKWISENIELGKQISRLSGEKDDLPLYKEWQRKVYEAGFLGISWPKEYGGYGDEPIKEFIAFEEFTRAGIPLGSPVAGIGLRVVGPSLIYAGSEDQKKRYLRKILTGEEIWCQGFSEPSAGSDLASIQTRAEDKGDYYEINGQKIWSSYAHLADYMILLARTGKPEDRHKGLTMFIVDMKSPGITVKPIRQITGRSEFNSVYFDRVKIPKENVIGKVNEGWRVAMIVLNNERFYIGLPMLLMVDGALKNISKSVRDLKPIEDLLIEALATKFIYQRMSELYKKGVVPGPETALIKLVGSELLQKVHEFAVNQLGPEALILERTEFTMPEIIYGLLASRSLTIAGGTSEILRNLLGELVLRLPK